MPWSTPSSVPSERKCLTLIVPDAADWRQALLGALLELTYLKNWEEEGLTPAEVTEVYRDVFGSQIWGGCMPPGCVVPYTGDTAPDGFLLCDGSAYNTADYPALFAAIGYKFGGSAGSFNVPNMAYSAPIGAGTISGFPALTVGNTGGAVQHTLTTAQMPSHTHTIFASGFQALQSGAGGLAPDYYPFGTQTQPTGGGGAHNNMPPYAVFNFIICT